MQFGGWEALALVRATRRSRADLRGFAFILVCGLIFCLSYAVHSQLPGEDVRTKALATLQSYWPYKPRVLSPWIVYHLFGDAADSIGVRFAWAFVMWGACVALLDRTHKAFGFGEGTRPLIVPCFTLVMLAHYSLPNVYAPYFAYDLPATAFYLVTFLLLISRSRLCVLGVLCGALFFLNRETIIVASCHAFAVRAAEIVESRDYSVTSLKWLIPSIAAGVVGMIMRSITLKMLHGSAMEMITGPMYFDSTTLRVVENFRLIGRDWGQAQQLLAIGFGVIVYLPVVFFHLPSRAKFAVIMSIIPMIPLVVLGNLLEIRVYSEFVPLMAFMLALSAAGLYPQRS